MLYPVSKLETVCPLGSEYPCGGLAPWAGLERAEGHGLCARGLASVPPLQQKMDSTVPASDPAGRPALSRLCRLARGAVASCVGMTPLGQSPLHLVEGRAPLMPPTVSKTASFVPPWPAWPFPMRSQPLSLLAPPLGDKWQQGSGSQYLQAA